MERLPCEVAIGPGTTRISFPTRPRAEGDVILIEFFAGGEAIAVVFGKTVARI
jgi:hypothetical protein